MPKSNTKSEGRKQRIILSRDADNASEDNSSKTFQNIETSFKGEELLKEHRLTKKKPRQTKQKKSQNGKNINQIQTETKGPSSHLFKAP